MPARRMPAQSNLGNAHVVFFCGLANFFNRSADIRKQSRHGGVGIQKTVADGCCCHTELIAIVHCGLRVNILAAVGPFPTVNQNNKRHILFLPRRQKQVKNLFFIFAVGNICKVDSCFSAATADKTKQQHPCQKQADYTFYTFHSAHSVFMPFPLKYHTQEKKSSKSRPDHQLSGRLYS